MGECYNLCVRPTILQAHPQLFVVFLLHVVDDLALVLEGVRLLDAGHEVSLYHRAGRTVEQVTIWKVLIQMPSVSLCTATKHLSGMLIAAQFHDNYS